MTARVRDGLREEVLDANLTIPKVGLATLTWGNVSGVDREAGVFVIKPSGVPYDALTIDDLVTVRLSDGAVVDGHLRPSTDTETHRCLYLAFPSVGGVTHTHSTHAVAFAQARRDIPVLGTTHADTFNGPIPCTPDLSAEQCAKDYEYNTGRVIVDMLAEDDQRAAEVPAALVASMFAGSALAAALSTTGVIQTIDPAKSDIVLQTGETFMLPAKFDVKKIKVGEKVKVTYTKKGDEMVATKVAAAK